MNITIKAFLTIIILIVPIIYLYKYIDNIRNIDNISIKRRLIDGFVYIVLVAIIIDLVFLSVILVWL